MSRVPGSFGSMSHTGPIFAVGSAVRPISRGKVRAFSSSVDIPGPRKGGFETRERATPRCSCVLQGGPAVSAHFVLYLLETPTRITFSIIHQFDRGVPAQRPGDDGRGVRAKGLVNIVVAILKAHRPLESDGGQWAGAKLGISMGFNRRMRWRRLWDACRSIRPALGFRHIENAGNGSKRMVGWVALTHGSGSGSSTSADGSPSDA